MVISNQNRFSKNTDENGPRDSTFPKQQQKSKPDLKNDSRRFNELKDIINNTPQTAHKKMTVSTSTGKKAILFNDAVSQLSKTQHTLLQAYANSNVTPKIMNKSQTKQSFNIIKTSLKDLTGYS